MFHIKRLAVAPIIAFAFFLVSMIFFVGSFSYVAFAEHSDPKTIDTTNNAKNIKVDGSKNLRNGAMTLSFSDNEQISVILSKVDINRISVQGDKIQSLNGPTGLYTAKNDPSGAAYLTLYANTPFILYVNTVNNHNLSLFITPQATVGKTIVLISTSPTKTADHLEDNSIYQKLLVTLMDAMINKKMLDDYAFSVPKKVKSSDFFGIADLKPIAFYNGAALNGVIYEMKNKTQGLITLRPSYFYQAGVRAVALSKQTIEPKETGLLYEIVSAEQTE